MFPRPEVLLLGKPAGPRALKRRRAANGYPPPSPKTSPHSNQPGQPAPDSRRPVTPHDWAAPIRGHGPARITGRQATRAPWDFYMLGGAILGRAGRHRYWTARKQGSRPH